MGRFIPTLKLCPQEMFCQLNFYWCLLFEMKNLNPKSCSRGFFPPSVLFSFSREILQSRANISPSHFSVFYSNYLHRFSFSSLLAFFSFSPPLPLGFNSNENEKNGGCRKISWDVSFWLISCDFGIIQDDSRYIVAPRLPVRERENNNRSAKIYSNF